MEIKAKMAEPLVGFDSVLLQFRVPRECQKECLKEYSRLKDKDIALKVAKYTVKRSLDANAYFHVLVDKIAKEMNLGADEVKVKMVLEYGTVDTDDEGVKVGIKLPASVDVKRVYEYAKWFDVREENGKKFNCYILYKHTSDHTTAEMATLIKGVIQEAEQLGIDTATPEEQARMLALFEKNKEKK